MASFNRREPPRDAREENNPHFALKFILSMAKPFIRKARVEAREAMICAQWVMSEQE
jgi:hypothetical protein